ncbi:hypothetical protein M8756_01905 [Lutimaribacter sp. EGI FJ00015]|uniref:Uncharacterized protein n=1 Tax=Lutimaribacter degradans TaxID=2945989 RepID=A0ACC5ZT52_9RHOB|nr:hypothetical protein [Lutimaribacter sp. EGI FJ00013]MCM2561005.1 hypothetical protein [Lutimaribacter sp. EGI FJ00013]MCO0612048.1 hypothetical protein [Lutimaribacter sp. EGI FJ00015]MCO0634832.1 hypothetical protein [Lutimaribacter sp. EGI FJ00014]
MSDFEDSVIEDDGTPLPSLGKVRMSPGARKLRERLTGSDAMKVSNAEAMDPEAAMERLTKRDSKGRLKITALADNQLVLLFAQLDAAGASDIEKGRVKRILKENWPEYTSNFLDAARNLAECERAAARRRKRMKSEDDNVIDVNGFDDLWSYGRDCLEKGNRGSKPRLFRHGSEIVRIPEMPTGEARIEILTQKSFNHELNMHAPFRKTRGDSDYVSAAAPKEVAEHLFADPALPLSPLEKIVTVPTFTKDGKLIQTPGYDKASGLLYCPDPNLTVPAVDKVDEAAAKDAAAYLVDLFADFPFDGCSRAENIANPGASLTNFIGLLLTPFVSPIIDDVVPAHLLTKPAPGTGASLLAEACQLVIDGKTDLRPPLSRNEDERRKALFTALQTLKNFLVYDNVAGEMDSATIASFLTSREWTDRILGRTGERTVRNASATVWTGINPGFSPELQRRISLIKLDAKMAKPGERDPSTFKVQGDFKSYIRQHRGEIIGACLTLVKHWIQSGQKNASDRPLASFERWHWTVGGILEAAGLTRFQGNREELAVVTGGEGNPMQSLIQAWYEAAHDPLTPVSMEAKASGEDGLLALVADREITLPLRLRRDALSDYDYSPKSFGNYLAQAKDSTLNVEYNGREIAVSLVFAGRGSGGVIWRLVERQEKLKVEASNVRRIGRPRGWRSMTDAERDAWATMDETERHALLKEVRERAKAA